MLPDESPTPGIVSSSRARPFGDFMEGVMNVRVSGCANCGDARIVVMVFSSEDGWLGVCKSCVHPEILVAMVAESSGDIVGEEV